jgi:CubicO group peptidase (beta-lactamase class C family)
MNKLFSLLVIALLFFTSSYAQSNSDKVIAKNLDSLITSRFANVSPGCVILVMKNGDTLFKKAFGSADLELHVAMQPDMVFRIGSVTKQYTAIAILQLVEQGKISLQDSIQKFIRDFPYKGHTITIENLLTHTSGIVDYEVLNFPIPNAIRIDFPPKQIIDSLSKLPLDFIPGSKFHYSNSNYFLLAYIIEQVSGQSYKDYLKENLFKPAGLDNTYYDSPTEIIPNRVSGYAKHNSKYSNAGYISMSQVFGAGALLSNVDDMYKWHQALYDYKLVKKETLDKALTPYRLSDGEPIEYGYGWIIKNRNGLKSIEHSGGIDGFQSDEIYFPQQDIFITTLYNSLNEGGDDMSFMALDNDIATLSTGKNLEKEISVDTSLLKQYVGVYEVDANNVNHKLVVTFEKGKLFIEASNPADRLTKVQLLAKSQNRFFIKEVAKLEFEFVTDVSNNSLKLITYNKKGKDAEWKKIE